MPTHGAKGLVTPANNRALTILRNMTVTGYRTGIVVHKHAYGARSGHNLSNTASAS